MPFGFSESEAFDYLCDWVARNPRPTSRVIVAERSPHFVEWLRTDLRGQVVALSSRDYASELRSVVAA
jgi:hypothetical protein